MAAVGSRVTQVRVGESVYGLSAFDRNGAAAEYVAVSAGLLAPRPLALGHVESAAIPLAALTAWQGLFEHGRLQPGERVLIHGARGGVGHFAIQLGRWCGATVIGSVSGTGDPGALGVDQLVDRSKSGFEASSIQ